MQCSAVLRGADRKSFEIVRRGGGRWYINVDGRSREKLRAKVQGKYERGVAW